MGAVPTFPGSRSTVVFAIVPWRRLISCGECWATERLRTRKYWWQNHNYNCSIPNRHRHPRAVTELSSAQYVVWCRNSVLSLCLQWTRTQKNPANELIDRDSDVIPTIRTFDLHHFTLFHIVSPRSPSSSFYFILTFLQWPSQYRERPFICRATFICLFFVRPLTFSTSDWEWLAFVGLSYCTAADSREVFAQNNKVVALFFCLNYFTTYFRNYYRHTQPHDNTQPINSTTSTHRRVPVFFYHSEPTRCARCIRRGEYSYFNPTLLWTTNSHSFTFHSTSANILYLGWWWFREQGHCLCTAETRSTLRDFHPRPSPRVQL